MMRRILSRIRRWLVRLWMLLCRVRPIAPEKIVVMSYYGGGYGDNGKAIVRSLLEKAPGLDIVWVGRPDTEASIPQPLRYVRFRSMAYYYELATAKVWIDNSRKGADVVKRRGQFYMQTWHGSVALKRIEKDAQSHLSTGYLEDARHDSRMADVILSGCGFFTRLIRRAFWYDGEILECGTPRLDKLFAAGSDRSALRKLGIPDDKKVVLYAPTFRSNGVVDCYLRDFAQVLSALKARTGEDWAAAVRLHPNAARKANWISYSDTVINATSLPDLYELLPVADLVISDYSSLIFEAGMLNKPVFLYATDVESYGLDRNFYFRLEELPFPLARNTVELLKIIGSFDENVYLERLEAFNDSIDYFEKGTASETAANRILEVIDNES